VKSKDGGVTWEYLIDPTVIAEANEARAAAANPAAASHLQELLEVQGMHTAMVTAAKADIQDAVAELRLDAALERQG
jgi:hypothetical protein